MATPSDPPTDAPRYLRELHRDADDIEKRITTSRMLYGDAELDAYVQSIADDLGGSDQAESLRVRVLRGRWPNAFVLPNGAAYVTTAMLDMLDNEAQLACVVGHELTHLVEQHAQKEVRSLRRRTGWTTAFAVLVGAVGAHYAGGDAGAMLANLTAEAGQLWTLSAVSGYSREHELDADRAGLERLVAAGYDGAQAPVVFELLKARTPETADSARPYFASHPKLEERIASFRKLLDGQAPVAGGRLETDRYYAALGELPLDQALLLIGGGFPDEAQHSAERYLARHPDSARAHFVAGEAWRTQGRLPDRVDQAIAAYGRAAGLPGAPPAALRNMGLLHRERGDHAAAHAAFERYLELDPQAVDAGLIRLYMQEQPAAPAVQPPNEEDPP